MIIQIAVKVGIFGKNVNAVQVGIVVEIGIVIETGTAVKGIVRRKLRWVTSGINRKAFL